MSRPPEVVVRPVSVAAWQRMQKISRWPPVAVGPSPPACPPSILSPGLHTPLIERMDNRPHSALRATNSSASLPVVRACIKASTIPERRIHTSVATLPKSHYCSSQPP